MAKTRGRKEPPEEADRETLFSQPLPSSGRLINREPPVNLMFANDNSGSLCWKQSDSGLARPVTNGWDEYIAAYTKFFNECKAHPQARSSAYVSVCQCGPEFVSTPFRPFAEAELPTFASRSGSPGAMWLGSAVRHWRARHAQMREDAVTPNKDIFFFTSDFHFSDGEAAFNEAVEEYRALENDCSWFTGFMVLAGPRPNAEVAARVSRKRPPVLLGEVPISELFNWASVIVRRASMSRPGQSVTIPAPNWELGDGHR